MSKPVNITKADYELQKKVGRGPMEESAVRDSQTVIDTNPVDFASLALELLDKLQDAIRQAGNPAVTIKDLKHLLTTPVMELKANAAIFHYDLIGKLAGIMLGFLEAITIMDADAIEIVKAHHKTLHMIVVRRLSGDGGVAGDTLTEELTRACNRYYHKKFNK